ncbi:hypothetical protein PSEUDO9AG_20061 [Pseudomonas sp. 9Ag]|nr:hypothetical protein PSEUDO9AG_20061 [Pseudomonas sp. 9Ag]
MRVTAPLLRDRSVAYGWRLPVTLVELAPSQSSPQRIEIERVSSFGQRLSLMALAIHS